ncbi:hypothetical protein BKA65DRAFT_549733 [Rhexocercosporidium sp. MPI-PUGE-AT-0058]|nr:hypothetical protein BKA65DRAFT_549733 [Rhexocercosporidium sp. MPI-PUGE-AT-0058]
MAEALGVVASGIAVADLAGKVTASIIKLKEYWDQVQEAPAEIKYLLREIDSLSLILSHIQDDQAKQTTGGLQVDNLCIRQSLELCKEGADELRGLADDLAEKVEGRRGWRKKVGSVKVVLKKEDVKKLKKRMKNAIRLLLLSYQWHTNAIIQLQPDIIVARMTEHISSVAIHDTSHQLLEARPGNTKDQGTGVVVHRQYDMWMSSASWITYLFGQFNYHQRTRMCKGRQREDVTTKYKLPEFITNKVLELQGQKTLSGWRVDIQTYRVIPYENPFFSAIENGDVVSVQRILANKEYFISDRNEFENDTALHRATAYVRVDISRLLLLEGADVLACNVYNDTPFHLTLSYLYHSVEEQAASFDICRTLVKAGVIDLLIDDPGILKHFSGTLEMLQYVHQQVLPAFILNSQYTAQEHITIAAGIAQSWGIEDRSALLVEYWLNVNTGIESEMIKWMSKTGQSFLHLLGTGFARYFGDRIKRTGECDVRTNLQSHQDSARVWHLLIRRTLSAGCSVFSVDHSGQTILSAVIEDCYYWCWPFLYTKVVLRRWLEVLAECGIDLLAYGNAEKSHWKSGNWGYECSCPKSRASESTFPCSKQHVSYRSYPEPSSHSLSWPRQDLAVSFSHGARPQDWVFAAHKPAKACVGDFWRLVEGGVCEEPRRIEPFEDDDESCSEHEWSEDDQGEPDLEPEAQPIPGSWSLDFEG